MAFFRRNRPYGFPTNFDAQIEWLENGGWRVELELHRWDGNPWKGTIAKSFPMKHSASWSIRHEASGALEKVVDELCVAAYRSLPPEGIQEA